MHHQQHPWSLFPQFDHRKLKDFRKDYPSISCTSPAPARAPLVVRGWRPKHERQQGACVKEAGHFFALFLETSSLHGLVHIAASGRTWPERVFWVTCVALAVTGCVTIGLNTLRRYEQNPTVISLERDYQMWETSLPSATVCPRSPWNISKINAYVESATNVTDKEALRFFLQNLTVASYDTFHWMKPVPGNPLKSKNYQTFVYDHVMHWNKDFEVDTNVSSTDEKMRTQLLPILESFTERGLCYSFNSAIAPYNAYEYWAHGGWDKQPDARENVGNPLSGDKFINLFMGFDSMVYTHWQGEAPDCTLDGAPLQLFYLRRRFVTALSTYSTAAVRALRVSQRGCRVPDDLPQLPTSPRYSMGLCRSDCRRRLAIKLCGCAPFFYRRVDDTPVCDEEQMLCLANHTDVLISLSNKKIKINFQCNCLPMCDEVSYGVSERDPYSYVGRTQVKTAFRWGMSEYPFLRLKRDIIFGFTDLLVAVGGTAGLFLGCSVLSFVEIAYFFTLRLFWHIILLSQAKKGKATNKKP